MHHDLQKTISPLLIETKPTIKLGESVAFVGSCFTQNIGEHLQELSYPAFIAPFGTLFNPHSISVLLNNLKKQDEPWQENQGEYFSMNYGHQLRHASKQELQAIVEKLKLEFTGVLQQCKHIFISLGTAWVYEYGQGQIAGNCHKLPSSFFTKRLLTPDEINVSLKSMCAAIKDINPEIKINFTISPVKHIRDGLIENNVSKAKLIAALYDFIENRPEFAYFPALEIVTEELRDYRYYSHDLAHPSPWTVNYIFNRWLETSFSPENQRYIAALQKLKLMKQHKAPLHEEQAWQQKIKNFEQEIKTQFIY
jgi:hypothetical protein